MSVTLTEKQRFSKFVLEFIQNTDNNEVMKAAMCSTFQNIIDTMPVAEFSKFKTEMKKFVNGKVEENVFD